MLVDTNVILEAHRIGSWRALAGGYRVESVEDCVIETQTGFQKRRPDRLIDADELRRSLAAVHPVADRESAELAVPVSDAALGRGEAALGAQALNRIADWILLYRPDKARLRCGVRLGFRERLVSLERLLDDVGRRQNPMLRPAYTRSWTHSYRRGKRVMNCPSPWRSSGFSRNGRLADRCDRATSLDSQRRSKGC